MYPSFIIHHIYYNKQIIHSIGNIISKTYIYIVSNALKLIGYQQTLFIIFFDTLFFFNVPFIFHHANPLVMTDAKINVFRYDIVRDTFAVILSPIILELLTFFSIMKLVIITVAKINNSNFECNIKLNYDPRRIDNIKYEYKDSSLSKILSHIKTLIK